MNFREYLKEAKKKWPKAIKGEKVYVELDKDFEQYMVFGVDSGHSYAGFYSEKDAKDYMNDNWPKNKNWRFCFT